MVQEIITVVCGENERFAQSAFSKQIGRKCPVVYKPDENATETALGIATVSKAVVAEDGKSAEITLDIE